MKSGIHRTLSVCLLMIVGVLSVVSVAHTAPQPSDSLDDTDLQARLQEIYTRRAIWILSDSTGEPIDSDYMASRQTARWALDHEYGKLKYMKLWAERRGVRFIEAKPTLRIKELRKQKDRARFYVEQSLAIGYTYPNEQIVNRFGVGTRHIIELRPEGNRWLIGMEWYTDPLGDDTEVPDVTPALGLEDQSLSAEGTPRYDRKGAVQYADEYCGIAWGCGRDNKYNTRYKDYNGVGGDCTNFVSQALREGGKLRIPIFTRVDTLASHLQTTGKARLVAKTGFQDIWKRSRKESRGFRSLIQEGDPIMYQEKGKLVHSAIVTGFDSQGYPLVNSHTADRYRVPFDLGWDKKTVYWFFHMRD